MADFAERLERLERQNRLLKIGLAATIASGITFGAVLWSWINSLSATSLPTATKLPAVVLPQEITLSRDPHRQ